MILTVAYRLAMNRR